MFVENYKIIILKATLIITHPIKTISVTIVAFYVLVKIDNNNQLLSSNENCINGFR